MVILAQIKALIALVILLLVAIPTCLLVIPFPMKTRMKVTYPMWGFLLGIIVRFGLSAKIEIARDERSEDLRSTPPYGLYIVNHQSYMDIPLLATMYQAPPIMKKEVLYIPFIGLLGWISGALPVSRSSHDSRKKVFALVRRRLKVEKCGIQVYPEGTRSKDATPKDFSLIKKTLIVFAYNENIPVIPTSIYGTRGIVSKNKLIKPGHHVGVIVHKELEPKDYASSDEFARACWEKVREGYEEMRRSIGPKNGNLSLV